MDFSSFIQRPALWLKSGDQEGIAVSSRVRLARNLAGRRFPTQAQGVELQEVWALLRPLLAKVPCLQAASVFDMEALDGLKRQLLFERHLISQEHLRRGTGSAVVVSEDQSLSVMVNEEDHIRMQGFSPGMNVRQVWQRVDELDSALEEEVPYAFSPTFGYLTSCPTNVGTGLRASVMMHLPGLVLLREMGPVLKGINTIGLTVRGLWGEGSEAGGHLFQVSNQITLGEKEVDIIRRLEEIVQELTAHERNARGRLLEGSRDVVMDQIGRARGILDNAWILSSREALDLLSVLRMGIELKLVNEWRREVVDELLVRMQPAHLQYLRGETLEASERDKARATLVRESLNRQRREEES